MICEKAADLLSQESERYGKHCNKGKGCFAWVLNKLCLFLVEKAKWETHPHLLTPASLRGWDIIDLDQFNGFIWKTTEKKFPLFDVVFGSFIPAFRRFPVKSCPSASWVLHFLIVCVLVMCGVHEQKPWTHKISFFNCWIWIILVMLITSHKMRLPFKWI